MLQRPQKRLISILEQPTSIRHRIVSPYIMFPNNKDIEGSLTRFSSKVRFKSGPFQGREGVIIYKYRGIPSFEVGFTYKRRGKPNIKGNIFSNRNRSLKFIKKTLCSIKIIRPPLRYPRRIVWDLEKRI